MLDPASADVRCTPRMTRPPSCRKGNRVRPKPGKTEAWVVLHSGVAGRIYAGLNPRSTDLKTSSFRRPRAAASWMIRSFPGSER